MSRVQMHAVALVSQMKAVPVTLGEKNLKWHSVTFVPE